jgi:hypothetical protein
MASGLGHQRNIRTPRGGLSADSVLRIFGADHSSRHARDSADDAVTHIKQHEAGGHVPRWAAWGITLAALVLIAAATLVPHPERVALVEQTPIWCLVCGDLGMVDVLGNVALFMPLGAGLALLGVPRRQAIALGALLSFSIELAQYVAIIGRDASLSDLITNTIGTALGAILAGSWRAWVIPNRSTARVLASATALIWLAQVALTGAAVRPALPTTVYWGQRAADLGQFDTFPGRLLDARIGTATLPGHRLTNSAEVRHQLLSGELVTAVAEPAGPTKGIAPLASIFDDEQREILVLAQWKDDLLFRLRARAIDFELRPPAIRLPGVFHNTTGRTLTIAGGVRDNRLIIEANGPTGRRSRVLPLSAQWGWSLLLPFDYAFGSEAGWVSAFWVGCWLGLVSFWLRGTGTKPLYAAAILVLLLLLGLLAIPALFGETTTLAECCVGVVAATLGWRLRSVLSST